MISDNAKYSICELRTARCLTQKQVAKDLGVAVSTYRGWEKDLSGIPVSKGIAIADYYDVRLGQILLCP